MATFEAVYADPASDAARRALAEVLGDDPRGELIRLQLDGSRGAAKRVRALLKTHASEWLQPLSGALVKASVTWARGFPVGGRLAVRRPGSAPALEIPGLATLEQLDVGVGDLVHDLAFLRPFLLQPSLRGLRALDGMPGELLVDLAMVAPPFARLETLRCAPLGGSFEARASLLGEVANAMEAAPGLPLLRALRWTAPHRLDADGFYRCMPRESYGWLWDTEPGRRIEVFGVQMGPEVAPEWVTALRADPHPAPRRIEMNVVALERTEPGWRLTGALPKRPPAWLRATLEATVRLMPDVEVAVDGLS